MKFLVLSDLHLEHAAFDWPSGAEYDAVILAGDIHSPGRRAVKWARQCEPDKPVVIVPGNHEFYGSCIGPELAGMQHAAEGSNVRVLSRGSVELDDPAGGRVRVLGCTLWTDFLLPVAQDDTLVSDIERALAEANARMNDYQLIDVEYIDTPRGGSPRSRLRRRPLRAEDTLSMHHVDRAWLLGQLAQPFNGATVVVTHHAPHAASINYEYRRDWLTPSFVSELPESAFAHADLWVHGHTHGSGDYLLGDRCWVISNQRGYRRPDGSFENRLFDPALVASVPGSRNQEYGSDQ